MFKWVWAVVFLAQSIVKGAAFSCPSNATTTSYTSSGATKTNCLYSCLICLNPRPYNGSGVSSANDTWGPAGTEVVWSLASPDYSDGIETPNTSGLQSARNITQFLYLNARPKRSTVGASQALPYWMMLVYFDLVNFAESDEALFVDCDDGVVDEQCPASCTEGGDASIEFYRAKHTTAEGQSYRVPINYATHALDLSFMYGTSEEASKLLRSSDDASLMNLTSKNMPWKLSDGTWLLADQRVAEDLGTLALTTLLLREHNRKAALLRTEMENGSFSALECYSAASGGCTDWSDEELFEATRMWVISVFSHVTIQEFLPSLIGQAPSSYWKAYPAKTTDVRVDALFAAVGSRWIWSALSPVLRLVDKSWAAIAEYETIELKKATDSDVIPTILELYGVAPVVRGLIATPAREIDASITDQKSSFNRANATLDIQRARDLGVPTYNDAREAYNLSRAASYADISSDETTQALLKAMYEDSGGVDSVDALVGALAEDLATDSLNLTGYNSASSAYTSEYFIGSSASTVASSGDLLEPDEAISGNSTGVSVPSMGPLLRAILVDQFRRTYQGDQLWHRHINVLEAAMDYTLAELLSDNLDPAETYGNSTGDLPTASFYVPTWDLSSTASTEHSVTLKTGVYTMAWQEPGDSSVTITLTIVGMGDKGYFALGFGKTMRDKADIIFVKVETVGGVRTLTVEDRYTAANALPKADTETTGCEDNAPSVSGYSCSSTKCTVTFTRSLNTGDSACDKIISTGSNDVIWSFNLNAYDLQHGYNDRGSKTIDFLTGDSTTTTTNSNTKGFFALHGAVMLVAYGLCAPFALFIARYMKQHAWWLEWHEAMGVVTAQSSIPIAAAAMATTNANQFHTYHGKIGLVLFILSAVQVSTGLLRAMGIQNRGNKYFGDNYGRFHFWNTYIHRWCGRMMVPLGLANVYLGLAQISPQDTTILSTSTINSNIQYNLSIPIFGPIKNYAYFVWLGLLIVAFIYFEYGRLMRKSDIRSNLTDEGNKPHFTQEEFDDRILQGEKWIVVHDQIFDIGEYMKVHPGGSKIIKESIGLDVTKFMLGERKVGKGVFAEMVHKHSSAAFAALLPNLVGYLQVHDLYTEDSLPGGLLNKQGSAASSASSASSRKGRAFGPSFAQFEVVKKVKLRSSRHKKAKSAKSASAEAASEGSGPATAAGLGSERVASGAAAQLSSAQEEAFRPVYRFLLAPKEPHVRADALRVGWYHKFRLAREGHMIQRQYTPIASKRLSGGRVGYEYLIRLYPGGQMSEALRAAKVGTIVAVQGPFVINDLGNEYEHVYMLAAGTGVTPMLQLARYHIRSVLVHKKRQEEAEAEAAAAGTNPSAAELIALNGDAQNVVDDSASGSGLLSASSLPLPRALAQGQQQQQQQRRQEQLPQSPVASSNASSAWSRLRAVINNNPPVTGTAAPTTTTTTSEASGQGEPESGGSPTEGSNLQNTFELLVEKPAEDTETISKTTNRGAGAGAAWKRLLAKKRAENSARRFVGAPVRKRSFSAKFDNEQTLHNRHTVRAIELELLADDGDVGLESLGGFRPASTLRLLWQTRTDRDGFCLGDLQDLAVVSEGAFEFTHYYKNRGASGADETAAKRPKTLRRGGSSQRWSSGRFSSEGSVSFSEPEAESGVSGDDSAREEESERPQRRQSQEQQQQQQQAAGGEADRKAARRSLRFASLLRRKQKESKPELPAAAAELLPPLDDVFPEQPDLSREATVPTNVPAPYSTVGNVTESQPVAYFDIEAGIDNDDGEEAEGGGNSMSESGSDGQSRPRSRRGSSQSGSAASVDAFLPGWKTKERRTGGVAAISGVNGTIDAAAVEKALERVLEGIRWAKFQERHSGAGLGEFKEEGPLGGGSGLPSERPDNTVIVVSGPPRFADGIQALLRSLGVPEGMALFLD